MYVYQLIRHRLRNILYIRIDCLLIYELTCLACGQVGGEEVGAHREGPLLLLRLNQFNNTLYLSFNPSLTYSLFSLSLYLSISLSHSCFDVSVIKGFVKILMQYCETNRERFIANPNECIIQSH